MDSDVDNLQKLKYLFCSDCLIWRAVDDDEVIIRFNIIFIVGHIISGDAAAPQSCAQGAELHFNCTRLLPFSDCERQILTVAFFYSLPSFFITMAYGNDRIIMNR